MSKDFEIVIKLNRDIGKDKVKLFDLEREIETLIRSTTGSSNEVSPGQETCRIEVLHLLTLHVEF